MKKKSFSLLILLLITGLFFYISENEEPTQFSTKPGYDQVKKADKPELFLSLNDELSTKPGQLAPEYPSGYRFYELEKAQSNLNRMRLQETYDFIERGPANVPGRTRGLIVDPDDPSNQTWFAGGVGGGIWKTTNGGQSWQDQTTDIPNLAISWLVMAESNHDILYAGTGEGWGGSTNFIKGNGILKSVDHGTSWAPLEATMNNPSFEIVNRLIVDPNNPDIVVAATSTDRRYNPNQASGIYKTIDGGLTWNKQYNSESYVQQIIANPEDFAIQYAAEFGIGVKKSIDGGETWTSSSAGMVVSQRIELAISPVDPNRLYASAQGDLSGSGADLYYSDDAGANWNLAVNASGEAINFLGGQGWYDNTILAHPFNLDEVYVGGVDFWKFKVSSEEVNLGNRFVGADEENLASFFTLLSFDAGDIYNDQIATGPQNQEDFVSVEIRFGPDGQGGFLKQMAHRFIVPDGRGSGVDDADYSYADYVEVPFQVWDIENDQQLMVAFRDQQKDGVFNLLELETENSLWQENSREYLFVSKTPYDPDGPDSNMTTNGGHLYDNLYFMWPYLPAGGNWNQDIIPEAIFRIRYQNIAGTSSEFISIADAYGRYGGPNSFSQTTGATTVTGVHPDHHNIVAIVENNAKQEFQLLIANDGGIYISDLSEDPGNSDNAWDFASQGYNTSQFYAVDKAPGESRYVGGLQDNGTWMSSPEQEGSASAQYRRVNGGDGFGTAWNYADKRQILSTIYNNRIEKSTNEGGSSVPATTGLNDVGGGRAPFVTELEYFQADPHVVFTVGSSGVWRSEDFGDQWTLAPITNNWRLFSTMFARISLANPNIVWAGTGMSTALNIGFHVSVDAGESFSVTNFADNDLGRSSGLATHPLLDSTAFALFSFAKSPKILRTDDLGQTWTDISGFESGVSTRGFPDVSVRDLLVMPNDTSVIWAATEIGIFESTDSGDSWHLLPGNLPAIPVWDLKIVDKEVVVGSHGRGIWSVELESLSGHVYIPEIISVTPTIAGEPVFQALALSKFDSAILFVNDQRVNEISNIAEQSFFSLKGTGITNQSGNAYLRAYRDGRPFVSKRFNYSLFSYSNVLESYSNDFENGSNADFEGLGFSVRNSPEFDGRALHSDHYYEINAENYYILKHPIRVKETNALINFVEVALVEPGEPGALPGTPEFRDYVVVQGSLDGSNWIDLVEPYDASNRQLWEASFGPLVVPGEAMIFFRSINMQKTFEPGDEILIRFVLRSDGETTGWGWMIDNLNIQTESVITDLITESLIRNFELYPNPVSGNSFSLIADKEVDEVGLQLIDANGQVKLRRQINLQETSEIDLPLTISNGIYILRLSGPRGNETHKLIIDR